MKCVNCNGEVDSQAIKCPYCGSRNEEGIQFNKEVYQKVYRNKLLGPILLRQQTPELMQKVLTWIILAMLAVSAVFFGVGTFLGTRSYDYDSDERQAAPGSHAEAYLNNRTGAEYSDYWIWSGYANLFIDAWETGTTIRDYDAQELILAAYDLIHNEDMDQEYRQAGLQEVNAVFVDMLRFSEEEMALFQERDDEYQYIYALPEETREKIFSIMTDKRPDLLEEVDR